MIMMLGCFLSMGCFSRTEVLYARATKKPENLTGVMRLAQGKVRVHVEGTNRVGTFRTMEPLGYMLIHEADLAKLLENTRKLLELRNVTPP